MVNIVINTNTTSCSSHGYCDDCNIIVADYTCFCAGGKCPKCKNHINPSNLGKLNGIFEKYYLNQGYIKVEYKDGKFIRII